MRYYFIFMNFEEERIEWICSWDLGDFVRFISTSMWIVFCIFYLSISFHFLDLFWNLKCYFQSEWIDGDFILELFCFFLGRTLQLFPVLVELVVEGWWRLVVLLGPFGLVFVMFFPEFWVEFSWNCWAKKDQFYRQILVEIRRF